MENYGEPEWVNPNTTGGNNQVTGTANTDLTAPTQPTVTASSESPSDNGGLVLSGLSVLGIGLAAMMGALGVLTVIEVHENNVDDLSEPFLACYMVMFAFLLFMYELMWWVPMPWINKTLRKNFGFLYGLRGKGGYLIFAGCLCLGLGRDASVQELNMATGIAFLGAGCLHWFVICFHPDLAGQYVAPTAGLLKDDAADNVV